MGDITKYTVGSFTVGLALDGAGWHPASWRDSDAGADRLFTTGYWGDLAARAEADGIDYISIDDSLALQRTPQAGPPSPADVPPRPDPGIVSGRLDAALLASWLAPRTTRIGLIV